MQQVDEQEIELSESFPLLGSRGQSTLDRLQSYASVRRVKQSPGLVTAAEDRACTMRHGPSRRPATVALSFYLPAHRP